MILALAPPVALGAAVAAAVAVIVAATGCLVRARRAAGRAAALETELARERARRADLERFACTVSHDLRTPLARLGFLLTGLEDDLETGPEADVGLPDATRQLDRMRVQLRRMEALIEGVLEYSAAGADAARTEPIDTRAVLEEIGETLELGPGQLVLVDAMPVIETCRTPFVQVMSNLVGNARKYHPEPAEAVVRVRVARLGDRWRFSVSDNGAGIDPRFHERIFGMFGRGEPGRGVESTGVGLSIVRRCVESVGGEVRVESVPGRGAVFRVDWPDAADAPSGNAAPVDRGRRPVDAPATLLKAARP